jgi:hypothetical protein
MPETAHTETFEHDLPFRSFSRPFKEIMKNLLASRVYDGAPDYAGGANFRYQVDSIVKDYWPAERAENPLLPHLTAVNWLVNAHARRSLRALWLYSGEIRRKHKRDAIVGKKAQYRQVRYDKKRMKYDGTNKYIKFNPAFYSFTIIDTFIFEIVQYFVCLMIFSRSSQHHVDFFVSSHFLTLAAESVLSTSAFVAQPLAAVATPRPIKPRPSVL